MAANESHVSEVSQVQTAEGSAKCKRARDSTEPLAFLGLVKLQRSSFRLSWA